MPFVSQASLDAMLARIDEHRDRADENTVRMVEERRRAERAEARVVELTETLLQMKRQNYHPAEPASVQPAPVMVPPSPVELAIRAKIPRHLRRGVYEEVATWRAKGMSDEAIVKRIEVGEGAA